MSDIFEWPCRRRTAHGPHPRDRFPDDPDECPGVKAHPATQIGGDVKSERPELREQS